MLFAKTKLNRAEVFNISHDEFVSVKNVLKEYDYIKEKIKNSKNK